LSDPDYRVPSTTHLQIQADAASQGRYQRTPVVLKAVAIHPKPQSPDALTPVAVTTSSDAVAELRERAPQQMAEIDALQQVTINCRCRHGGHGGGSCKPHKHVIMLLKLVGGDLNFLHKLFGIGSCSCTFPCYLCRISKEQLSQFDHTELRRFTARTMRSQIGLSAS
jgi:hypothetical protein